MAAAVCSDSSMAHSAITRRSSRQARARQSVTSTSKSMTNLDLDAIWEVQLNDCCRLSAQAKDLECRNAHCRTRKYHPSTAAVVALLNKTRTHLKRLNISATSSMPDLRSKMTTDQSSPTKPVCDQESMCETSPRKVHFCPVVQVKIAVPSYDRTPISVAHESHWKIERELIQLQSELVLHKDSWHTARGLDEKPVVKRPASARCQMRC